MRCAVTLCCVMLCLVVLEVMALPLTIVIPVQVFKTSILVFRDRERYVTGDFRFRGGTCKVGDAQQL